MTQLLIDMMWQLLRYGKGCSVLRVAEQINAAQNGKSLVQETGLPANALSHVNRLANAGRLLMLVASNFKESYFLTYLVSK